jgi:hypothetical protein
VEIKIKNVWQCIMQRFKKRVDGKERVVVVHPIIIRMEYECEILIIIGFGKM